MPRIARTVVTSYPHHVVHRGNNREEVFFEDADRRKYLDLLKKYSEKRRVKILAYCLMKTHAHLLVVPMEDGSLSGMMQGVAMCYTQFVNKKYGTGGRLWESRYHSCVIDDAYLLTAASYIDTHPVRANMARRAEDYAFSSARSHMEGFRDDVLNGELFDEPGREAYRALVRAAPSRREITAIRRHTKSGRPLGREGFLESIEAATGRVLSAKRAGRPRKDITTGHTEGDYDSG